MTSLVTGVASVHFDERPHEWRTVHDPLGYGPLVDDVLAPPPADSAPWVRGHRMVIVSDRPYDPRPSSGPTDTPMGSMLLVAVTNAGEYGAAYFRDAGSSGEAAGWVTYSPEPVAHTAPLPFSAQGWNDFPATSVVSLDVLRNVVSEYMSTGERPSSASWRESEWVQ
jgi:hypothetical protein